MSAVAIKEPQSLNGLVPEQLVEAAMTIANDPTRAPVTFRASTAWQGAFRSRTEVSAYELAGERIVRRHAIHTDEPLELLGTNQAPNPQDLLLAALNSCMMVGFVAAATNQGIRIDSLEVESECTLDLRGAFGLDPAIKPGAEKIRYTLRVRGSASPEQFEAIHQEMTGKSPNRYHLTAPIPIESKLIVG